MRSKAGLQVMEQLIMIAVFSMAAAMCLQAYAASYRASRTDELAESAMSMADSVLDAFRAGAACPLEGPEYGRRFEGTFAEDWTPVPESDPRAAYAVSIIWYDYGDVIGSPPIIRADMAVSSPDGTVAYLDRYAVMQTEGGS